MPHIKIQMHKQIYTSQPKEKKMVEKYVGDAMYNAFLGHRGVGDAMNQPNN
jgi:hypothetical protein